MSSARNVAWSIFALFCLVKNTKQRECLLCLNVQIARKFLLQSVPRSKTTNIVNSVSTNSRLSNDCCAITVVFFSTNVTGKIVITQLHAVNIAITKGKRQNIADCACKTDVNCSQPSPIRYHAHTGHTVYKEYIICYTSYKKYIC